MIINILGFTASVISFVLWLPQAKLTYLNRHNPIALQGISIQTQILVILNALIWFVYAILLGEFWVGAPGLINGPLAIFSIILVMKANVLIKENKTELNNSCQFCGFIGNHKIFIDTPPGYGSLMDCSNATVEYGHPIFV